MANEDFQVPQHCFYEALLLRIFYNWDTVTNINRTQKKQIHLNEVSIRDEDMMMRNGLGLIVSIQLHTKQ